MSDKITMWGQIKFVCPCNSDEKVSFELKQQGGLVFYVCKNPNCPNSFNSDIALKLMDKLNNYYKEHKTFDKFSWYFRVKEDSMRMRYIKTMNITNDFEVVVIEVTNLTRQPQYRGQIQNQK